MAVDAARAKSLFLAASDLADVVERADYLERECNGDADLRNRVEALLRANDAAPLPPLDAGNGTSGYAAIAPDATGDYQSRAAGFIPAEVAGTVIAGKYKLLELIGEGGMGSVWMAQQTEPVKRHVAVKLIKAGMDSRQVIARFEAERQALAVMDHPNIAKILDGGVADNGAPYFVMELVKGVPITKYCDEHKLTPRQRLELFVPVCQAIQHAHQKGIIHRDIKPSNVMVAPYDDKPVPKVIDFGVAKATGQSLTDHTLNTGFGGIAGTPQYMSPEQATLNNIDIDTRSDIYSLGVLLYELLSGSPPFAQNDLEKAGVLEMLRVIREDEPPRPSTKLSTADALPSLSANRGTEPKKLTGILRNELDWIVMKALEKDRKRRYETANGFAADINRYLAGEPVNAHPPSAGYRLRKLMRRNKGQMLAALAILFAILAGVAGVVVVQTRSNRDLENKNAELTGKYQELADEQVKVQVQRTLAETRLGLLRNSINAFVNEANVIGENDPLAEGCRQEISKLVHRLVHDLQSKGDLGSAVAFGSFGLVIREGEQALARNEYAIASEKFARAREDLLAVMKTTEDKDKARNNLALVDQLFGDTHTNQRKYVEGEKYYRQALTLRQQILKSPNGDINSGDLRLSIGGSYIALGKNLVEQARHREALSCFEDARVTYESIAENDLIGIRHDGFRLKKALLSLERAQVAMALNNKVEARTYFESAVRQIQDDLKQSPSSTSLRLNLSRASTLYGDQLLLNCNEPVKAMEQYELAQKQLRDTLNAQQLLDISKNVALNYYRFGVAELRSSSPEEAKKHFLRCLEIRDRRVRDLDDARAQPNGIDMIYAKIDRMLAQARCGMHLEAAKTATGLPLIADKLETGNKLAPKLCLQSVCGFALCSVAMPPGSAEQTAYLEKAMVSLRKAIARGFDDWHFLRVDPDLDPLRGNENFEKLLAELEAKADKKPEAKLEDRP